MTDATDRIREFIQEEILFGVRDSMLNDDTPLLSGILDSMSLTQIATFLEEEFDIEFIDGDISAPNFRTIADINRLIRRKQQEKT